MAAGRRSRYLDYEFRDREADVKLSRRKDCYRDRLHDGGFDSGRGHPHHDFGDRIGVAQGDIKRRGVINDYYRSPLSSNSSGGSKNSQKLNHLSGKDMDRETGELSSGSGSDDAEAPISKIKDNGTTIHDNGNSYMDDRKRKLSPIIWDRNDSKRSAVVTSSSKSTVIENDTLPPPPPRPLGFVPAHSIDAVQLFGTNTSPSDVDISVESPQPLSACNYQEVKLSDDFEDEPAPARSISFSRWADKNIDSDDGDESLKVDIVPKKKKNTPLSSSSGQHLHKKTVSPELGDVIMAENSGVDFSKSYSREHEYDGLDAELDRNDHMSVDGAETSTSDQIFDTDAEDEDGRSKTPEPAQPSKRCIDMLQGCRSVDEFERLNKIDEGTYGVVYRAKDKKTGEIVALKKVKMEKEKEGFPLTSLREINILLSFHHPSIVDVKEVVVGSELDKIFMVMEYMEHDLKALMETMKKPYTQSEVKCLMLQLLSGVKYLHDNWVVHRGVQKRKRKAVLIWEPQLSAVSGDRSLTEMNWCSPKWMATTVGCFAGGTALFVAGAYFSYVNIEPQRARTLARDQLLKDYLRKKYGYGITRSPPLQVLPVPGFPLISTLSPASSPSTPPLSSTTSPVPSVR